MGATGFMLDIKWIRDNPEAFGVGLLRRGAASESVRVLTLDQARREAESRTIRAVLKHTDGHKAQAAKILGISRKNLWEKMRDYDIEG